MGGFPVLVEETPDEDNYVPEGMNMPEGGVNSDPDDLPGLCAVDDKDMDDSKIEDEDRIFVAHVHSADPNHFIHAIGTVSTRLAEAHAKNTKAKSFCDIILDHLHDFEDIFNEQAFDSLPEKRKWDHAIELERKPSPGFRKVYPMSLEEQGELDAFLSEALRTGRM